ncbi:MAG: WG repeat-containing protein, partial [Ignavibacteria bacterium]
YEIDRKCGLKNNKGKVLFDTVLDSVKELTGNGGYLIRKDEKFGLVSEDDIILPPQYDAIEQSKKDNNWIVFKQNKKLGAVKYGKVILKPIYDSLEPFGKFIRIECDKKFGLIKDNGEVLLNPKYDSIEFFKNNISDYKCIRIEENKKFGLLNEECKLVLDVIYDSLELKDGYFIIEQNNKFGLVYIWGKILLKPIYEEIIMLDSYRYSSDYYPKRYFLIKKDGNFGLSLDDKILKDTSSDSITFKALGDGHFLIETENNFELFYEDKIILSGTSFDSKIFKSLGGSYYLMETEGNFEIIFNGKSILKSVDKSVSLTHFYEWEVKWNVDEGGGSSSDRYICTIYLINNNSKLGLVMGSKILVEPQYRTITPISNTRCLVDGKEYHFDA